QSDSAGDKQYDERASPPPRGSGSGLPGPLEPASELVDPIYADLATGFLHARRERDLAIEIVAQHPVLPEHIGRVEVLADSRHDGMRDRIRIRRRGIELRPSSS